MFTQIKNFLVLLMVITIAFPSACKTKYPPLRIGNSIGIKDMNYERLKAMKDAGIDCIEITTGGFISTKKPKTDAEITELLTRTKLAADSAGVYTHAFRKRHRYFANRRKNTEKQRRSTHESTRIL